MSKLYILMAHANYIGRTLDDRPFAELPDDTQHQIEQVAVNLTYLEVQRRGL